MFDSSLAGRIVVVQTKPELIEKDPKTYSTYYDGEYFVVRASQKSLAGVKIATGYDSTRTLSFISNRYDVIEAYDDAVLIEDWLEDLEHFSKAPERGEKLRWTESVYTAAAENVRQARRAHERRLKALENPTEREAVEPVSALYTHGGTFLVREAAAKVRGRVEDGRFSKGFLRFKDRDGRLVFVSPHSVVAVAQADA